ncbi:unnamed protein product [Polarella glacialis]|uniref:Uncharacterized protein n=1 Tax=Polarella glacialis TaxID=89957 RepID=A0A813HZE9_POLGL|nr:unnamed protein product [Polarella glacialis]
MTHFNLYKHLNSSEEGGNWSDSSVHRQAAADRHQLPASRGDILQILGDVTDSVLPIYRSKTMVTVFFSSSDGSFQAWHGSNPATSPPLWQSSVASLFESSTLSGGRIVV